MTGFRQHTVCSLILKAENPMFSKQAYNIQKLVIFLWDLLVLCHRVGLSTGSVGLKEMHKINKEIHQSALV